MNINELMDKIVKKAKIGIEYLGWDKDDTIRFIYISLGKEISKNIKFFYSAEKKYDEENRLNISQMQKIHESDAAFEVTCRVSAKMLVNMLNRVGIEAKIKQTVESDKYQQNIESNEEYDIYHYFVSCIGEQGKNYFLTLNADLINIKFGFATEHFATNIPYYVIDIKTGDFKLDENGEKIPYYQGEKVDNTIMTDEKLREIDQKIEYLTNFGENMYDYIPDLSSIHKKEINDKYIDALIIVDNHDFYKGLEELFSKLGKENLKNLTNSELAEVETYICYKSISLIESKLSSKLDNEIKDKINNLVLQKKFDLVRCELNKFISNMLKENKIGINEDEVYGNPFAISSAMINLLNSIEILVKSNTPKEKKENSAKYKNSLHNLLKYFVDQSKLRRNKSNVERNPINNNFLYQKLKMLFIRDFECEETSKTGYLPDFCKYGIMEQQNFIKEYIKKIFQVELKSNDKFQGRILFSSMALDESLDNYCFLIGIYNDTKLEEHSYFFIYNPLTNTIKEDIPALELILNYKVFSQTVNKKLEQIENAGRRK